MSFSSPHLHADGYPSNPSAGTWIAFGDSLTEGMTYPLWLSQSLAAAGKPVPYWVNAGIGGNTSGQMLARMDRDVLAYHPAFVIFNCGINDLLQHNEQHAPMDFNQNIDAILSRLKQAGIPACVNSTTALAAEKAVNNADLKVMNDYLRAEAVKYGFKFADIFDPFLAAMARGEQLTGDDHIHLTEEGYNVYTTAVLKAIAPGVALSTPWAPQPEPGLVPAWKVSSTDNPPRTLDVHVPETEPVAFWWKNQERKRGFVLNLKDRVQGAKGFVADGTIHVDAAGTYLLKVGGQVASVSVDGKPVTLLPTNHTWGIRDGARLDLTAGDHPVQLAISDAAFFFAVVPGATP